MKEEVNKPLENQEEVSEKATESPENNKESTDNIESTEEAPESIPEEAPKEEPKSELEIAQAQAEEMKDKYMRLMAEFENYKRRSSKERIELFQTAGKEVISSLLPVLDDFNRAKKQIEDDKSENLKEIKEGILLIFNKLTSTLNSKGLEEMDSLGKDFDTELHEAITEIPAPTEKEKGKVLDVLQKGYLLNQKIIRFAQVVVGK